MEDPETPEQDPSEEQTAGTDGPSDTEQQPSVSEDQVNEQTESNQDDK